MRKKKLVTSIHDSYILLVNDKHKYENYGVYLNVIIFIVDDEIVEYNLI